MGRGKEFSQSGMTEIVERSSGYYLVNDCGVVAGPFESLTEAKVGSYAEEVRTLLEQYSARSYVLDMNTKYTPQSVKVWLQSPISGRRSELQVRRGGLLDWLRGALIQNALPELSDSERELLMTGITEDEWESFFGLEDEEML